MRREVGPLADDVDHREADADDVDDEAPVTRWIIRVMPYLCDFNRSARLEDAQAVLGRPAAPEGTVVHRLQRLERVIVHHQAVVRVHRIAVAAIGQRLRQLQFAMIAAVPMEASIYVQPRGWITD